ncbi:MAG: DUF2161 family putative PD-(D/E)XK-type phosphodiesterase [Oceanospirillaceae bacterium]
MKESQLYEPVKYYLELLGFQVKAEVHGCDLVAQHSQEDIDTLIVELKLSFSLELIHQGVDRKRLSDNVYLAVPEPNTSLKRRNWRRKLKANLKLCRLLGLGLMTVNLELPLESSINLLLDPAPYSPRPNKQRRQSLHKEFQSRVGDPNIGGVNKQKIMTAYRQKALICAMFLSQGPGTSLKELKAVSLVENVASILQKNYYGWFERVGRGKYCLTHLGQLELNKNREMVKSIISEKPY